MKALETRVTLAIFTALLSVYSASASGAVIAHYSFDSSATTDNSGNGRNLTNAGVTIDGSSAFGAGSGSFDGVSDYTYRANNDSGFDFSTGDFAVAFWYRRAGVGTSVAMVGNGDTSNISSSPLSGFTIRRDSPDIVTLQGNSLTTTGTADGNDAIAFQHIVAQRNGGVFELYSNGTLVDTAASAIDLNTGMAFSIGAQNVEINGAVAGSGNFFQGLLDEVWVFNNALSQEDIDGLIDGNTNPFGPGPGSGAIPEPSTLVLLVGMLAGGLFTRRGRR